MKCYHLHFEEKYNEITYSSLVQTTDIIISNELNYDKFIEKLPNYIDLDTIDLNGKKIYRYPKISLPRQKVETLKEKYSLKVVRDKSKSDYQVFSEQYLKNIIHTCWFRSVYYLKDMLEHLKKTSQNVDPKMIAELEKIKESHNGQPVCISVYWNMYGYGSSHNQMTSNFIDEIQSVKIQNRLYKVEDSLELNRILKAKTLLRDSDLASKTVEDSEPLTSEDYDSLVRMITSKNSEDVNVALEIMANSNVEKSIDVIGLVLYFYGGIIKEYSTNWNTVNIKTLAFRFKDFHDRYKIFDNVREFDSIINLLKDEDSLTEFALRTVKSKMMQWFNSKLLLNEQSAFRIDESSILLKSKFKDKLKPDQPAIDLNMYL